MRRRGVEELDAAWVLWEGARKGLAGVGGGGEGFGEGFFEGAGFGAEVGPGLRVALEEDVRVRKRGGRERKDADRGALGSSTCAALVLRSPSLMMMRPSPLFLGLEQRVVLVRFD